MKTLSRLPLYFGLSVFVISILFSAVKLGEQRSVTSQQSQAAISPVILSLKFTAPETVSLILNSEKTVAGIDALIKFDQRKINILPSSLIAGPKFKTTGGKIDSQNSTFAFSALSQEKNISSGLVASFRLESRNNQPVTSELALVGNGKTVIIDEITGRNILNKTEGVQVKIPAK